MKRWDHYKNLEVDSVKWHSMDPEARMKHVERYRRYRSTLDDQFEKPKSSDKKPSDWKWTRKPDFEVRLTGWTKRKRRAGNRLPSRISAPRKRYRMSYFSVQWYRAWLIDARETVGISCFRLTKQIILLWSHVILSVLWINKAKWAQGFAHCLSISRLNALKNTHGVYMMYTTKPSLCRELRLDKTHLTDYQRK